jgi:hypothetical protein
VWAKRAATAEAAAKKAKHRRKRKSALLERGALEASSYALKAWKALVAQIVAAN